MVDLDSKGSLFTVSRGVTLTLGNNVTLRGLSGNEASLVHVNGGGTLVMEDGSRISGNRHGNPGGGVYVDNHGAFTLNGGVISDNSASSGGGVYVSDSGEFTKQSGGVIYGWDAPSTALRNTVDDDGCAVYISADRKRNGTVGEGVTLDSAVSGAVGGWIDLVPAKLSLAESLGWIDENVVEGGVYIVALYNDESLAPYTLSCNGKNVNIILTGGAAGRKVSLNSNGCLFTVESGVTLTLGSNVILWGRSGNTDSLVKVNSGGKLVMEDDSKISGNSVTNTGSVYGGGVYVNGGTFTMNGGAISGNTVSSYGDNVTYGGGVYVSDNSTFTMSGGTISDNTASSTDPALGSCGGGVYNKGTFTMSDGTISGNTSSSYYSYGGGVANAGTFTMSGGTISGNTASSFSSGTDANANGGGVANAGTFTMSGGTISGNIASPSSSYYSGGGGVYNQEGTFTKSGQSTIYGDTDTTHTAGSTENTAQSGNGHAVYVYVSSSSFKKRNTTAGPGVDLDSAKDGAAGGWE
jgi:hypothetical protein